jgi:site-specific recombinase XerC
MKRRGVFTITVLTNKSGTMSYLVSGTKKDGTRVRIAFPTEAAAIDEKHRLEKEAAEFKTPKGEITYVLDGVQLRDAEKAILVLSHGTLEAAARYYSENHVPVMTDKTLKDAYDLYLPTLQQLRPISLRAYNLELKVLIDAHPGAIMNNVSSEMLKSFLTSCDPIPGHPLLRRPWSLSRQHYLMKIISPFFAWGVDEGFCGCNPAKKVKLKEIVTDEEEPGILSLKLLQQLLDTAWAYKDGKYGAYVVLTTWLAMRPTETRSFDISELNLEEAWAKVNGEVAKTRARRVVEIMPNALVMLQELRQRSLLNNEALNPSLHDWTTIRALAGLCGSLDHLPDWCFLPPEKRRWKDHRAINLMAPCSREELVEYVKDVLRHSGLSYHLAWFNDENRAASWGGNSPPIIHKHYKGLATTAEAEGFWTMLPTALKNAGMTVSPPARQR